MKNIIKLIIVVCALMMAHLVNAEERIDMEAMSIIGNKELPNVLYILPWKQANLPEMVELPLSSLINDALQPLDRQTILRRQYYKQVIKQQGVLQAELKVQK
ncbi:MAG: hypothetical protein DIZ80_12755 [endosymbiont of Galathealinum brachiosum]|uniref:Uncharacterized protein n=1 Tax=endosymbiont of Galathealinum brachiosum TaxID=2200906 RepID=A0A370DEZ1_9GAMM|nr:MAG: hypothetical protein DIZ80_12755 [endosymbiont of Galathealinum brachiosum]